MTPATENVIQCGLWHPWELLGRDYIKIRQPDGSYKLEQINLDDPLYKFPIYDHRAYLEERFGLKAYL